MIGKVKLTYTQKDLIALVRKDLIDKFGQRDLAPYDLSVPEVYQAEAALSLPEIPEPKVTVTSVADQVAELHLPEKQTITRAMEAISVQEVGLQSSFDAPSKTLTISSGTINKVGDSFPVKLNLGIPFDITLEEGNLVSYSTDGYPVIIKITEEMATGGIVTGITIDGSLTEQILKITWVEGKYEELKVINNAALNGGTKFPQLPKSPLVKVEKGSFEEQSFSKAKIQIFVDLEFGK